jgi:endonuclease/exonuclease/phosphatase family metal-dependent hydrolase
MPNRRTLLACLLALPLMSGACAPKAKPADAAAGRDPRTLRVMTYNIHITQGMDKRFDIERIANVIKANDVDVVAVQEVDIKARRSGGVDQLAELKRLTGMHGVFGKARDFDGGEYGQVILSRRPIDKMDVHQLPGAADQEQRIALVATIEQKKPLPDLLFVATHLHHKEEEHRLKQSAELNRILKDFMSHREPAVLVLGDLNATPASAVMTQMAEKWDDATRDAGLTFPADKPDRKIDYVLLPKGHGWKVISATVVDESVASDHRPVVVELKWKGD